MAYSIDTTLKASRGREINATPGLACVGGHPRRGVPSGMAESFRHHAGSFSDAIHPASTEVVRPGLIVISRLTSSRSKTSGRSVVRPWAFRRQHEAVVDRDVQRHELPYHPSQYGRWVSISTAFGIFLQMWAHANMFTGPVQSEAHRGW